MKNKVYWTGIEYKYNQKSKTNELKGGFVYAFVNSQDARYALKRFLDELASQDLKPIEIEFISPYDIEMEWGTDAEIEHYLNLYNESKDTNNVIFDDFYAYDSDLDIV